MSQLENIPSLILAEFDHTDGIKPIYLFQCASGLCDTTQLLASSPDGRLFGKRVVSGKIHSSFVPEAVDFLSTSRAFDRDNSASELSTVRAEGSTAIGTYAFEVHDPQARGTTRRHVWLIVTSTVGYQFFSRWPNLLDMLTVLANRLTAESEWLREAMQADSTTSHTTHQALRPLEKLLDDAFAKKVRRQQQQQNSQQDPQPKDYPLTLETIHNLVDVMFPFALGINSPQHGLVGSDYLLGSCSDPQMAMLAFSPMNWTMSEGDRAIVLKGLLTGSQIMISHERYLESNIALAESQALVELAEMFAVSLAMLLPRSLRRVLLRAGDRDSAYRIIAFGAQFRYKIMLNFEQDGDVLILKESPEFVHVQVAIRQQDDAPVEYIARIPDGHYLFPREHVGESQIVNTLMQVCKVCNPESVLPILRHAIATLDDAPPPEKKKELQGFAKFRSRIKSALSPPPPPPKPAEVDTFIRCFLKGKPRPTLTSE